MGGYLDQDQHGATAGWGPKDDQVRGFVRRTASTLNACTTSSWRLASSTAINGECFTPMSNNQLAFPLLKPGDIVIMGVPSSLEIGHSAPRQGRRRKALNRAALLPRPQSDRAGFRQNRHWMRSAQKRTIEDAWRHIGNWSALNPVTDTAALPACAGYASVKSKTASLVSRACVMRRNNDRKVHVSRGPSDRRLIA